MINHRLIHTGSNLVTILIVIVFVGGVVSAPAVAAPLLDVEDSIILLGRPTDHSITVNVIPGDDGEISFEYGSQSGDPGTYEYFTNTVTCTTGEPVEMVIGELTSNMQYYYRLRYRATSAGDWSSGDEHSFHTQRTPGSTFTFTIISDSHMNGGGGDPGKYDQTLMNVFNDHPDFHLDLGDTFWTDGATDVATTNQRYVAQRTQMGYMSHSAPVFVATGNHENEEGWNLDDTPDPADSLPVLSTNARKKYYLNPIPDDFYTGNADDATTAIDGDHLKENYYAWQWGDALFVVVDPFWYTLTKPYEGTAGGEVNDEVVGDRWDWTLGEEQYLWLTGVLENSDAPFKFVFAHHMTGGTMDYVRGSAEAAHLFEWGGYNADGTIWEFDVQRPGWGVTPDHPNGTPIHQLLVDNGVSAFFHGHDHEYAYGERDGVVYQLLPAPSMVGYGFDLYSEDDPFTIKVLPNSGHLRVTVSPSQATVDYVRSDVTVGGINGEVTYSYTIQPNTSPEPYLLGDVNGDETLNSTEALIILSCDAGLDTSLFCPMNCGDVNNDGVINSTDASIILSYDAGVEVSYPVGEPGCPANVTPCAGCPP